MNRVIRITLLILGFATLGGVLLGLAACDPLVPPDRPQPTEKVTLIVETEAPDAAQ